MAGLRRFFVRLLSFIWPWGAFRVVGTVTSADEIPDELAPRTAVVVGSVDEPTWVAFDCPCVEHHRVLLNLDKRRRPAWTMYSARPLTLGPSIDERWPKKRCHYFIRDGRVRWAHNSSREEYLL